LSGDPERVWEGEVGEKGGGLGNRQNLRGIEKGAAGSRVENMTEGLENQEIDLPLGRKGSEILRAGKKKRNRLKKGSHR